MNVQQKQLACTWTQ